MLSAVRPLGPGELQPVQMCRSGVHPETGVTSPAWDRRARAAFFKAGKQFSDRRRYKHEVWEVGGTVVISNQTIWRPEKASGWRQGSGNQGGTREEREEDTVTFCSTRGFGDLSSISHPSNLGQTVSPLSMPDRW